MEFIEIKGSDLNSSRIGLGTWAMGGWLWGGSDKKDCIKTLYKAFDSGVNFIDTAPVYGFGTSEEIVGEAIKQTSLRKELVIATKVGLEWVNGKVYRNSSKERILKEVDDSLRRLKTDYIDLYQVHWPDPKVPIEETAEAMRALLKDGKIRAIGVSNYSPEQMDFFKSESILNSSQPPYNLFERGVEDDVLPYCDNNKITPLLYEALCRGLLSGKLKTDTVFEGDDIRNIDPKFKDPHYKKYLLVVDHLDKYAQEKFSKNVLELSVRWILDKTTDSVTLWGARKPEQLINIKQVLSWKIDKDSMKEIEDIVEKNIEEKIGPEFMSPPPRP